MYIKNKYMNSQSITILTNNHQKLNALLLTPDEKKPLYPAVMFVHGWMSDLQGYISRAEALTQLGYMCLVFDMRGHGESDGKLSDVTAKGSLDDAVAAYDYLASLPQVHREQISVVGSSYGGYIAALLLSKRSVASVILRVPAIFRNQTFAFPKVREISNELKVYRQASIEAKDNYALQALSKFSNPVLLIESEKDTIIPHEVIEDYRQAVNKDAVLTDIVMKGADHSLTKVQWKLEFITILNDWFSDKRLLS
jgi:dipeptidyl aminopeptidase/acylaminoacyl peptidase